MNSGQSWWTVWLERLIHDDVCREYGVKSIEKADGGYSKGYVHALTQWRRVLDQLQTLRLQKKMAVVLIAHAKIETHSDPESASFDRFSPKLHKSANALLCEWSDMILLATRKHGASLGERGSGRILRCVGAPACVAKNRYGLPEELPLAWTSLIQAMRFSMTGTASQTSSDESGQNLHETESES